jgi:putative phosphoesterase
MIFYSMAQVRRIGLISDTHGLLRPEAVEAMKGSDFIVHAGDVGRPEVLDELRRIAPVAAVRGNVDQGPWADALPETAVVEPGLFVIHDVHEMRATPPGCRVVISGHSHRWSGEERGGVVYVNPGAAGPRRFRLPVTVARLEVAGAEWRVAWVDLTTGKLLAQKSY